MKKSKKVILFATSDIEYDQRMIKICNSLQKEGFRVCFVGRNSSQRTLDNDFLFQIKSLNCVFKKGVMFYMEFNLRIALFMLRNQADIYTANDLDTVLGVYFGRFFRKKSKLVFDAHEYFTEVPELRNKKGKKQIWNRIEAKTLPSFNSFYTVNESLVKIFKKKLNIDFQVVRNVPIFIKAKKKYNKNSIKYILYQGALNQGRGLEQIISAMPSINYTLKIAGKGDIEAQLKQQVQDLNLHDKVVFLGKIKPKDLLKITQNAHIGINLLENTSLNYYYSLANKFFDYLHQNIPQISMNFPEYKRINQQKEVAVLVKNLDKSSLVNAVKKLSDENFYKKLRENSKIIKHKYTWEKEEISLLKIYKEL